MKTVLKIDGLCCANCAERIEAKVRKIPGVSDANLSFMTQRLVIETESGDTDAIAAEASRIAKKTEDGISVKIMK